MFKWFRRTSTPSVAHADIRPGVRRPMALERTVTLNCHQCRKPITIPRAEFLEARRIWSLTLGDPVPGSLLCKDCRL